MKKGIFVLLAAGNAVYAGSPVWTFTPLTATNISVSNTGSAVVRYTVTNQSRKSHTLVMNSIPGITQDTSSGNCPNPFTLGYQQSCNLTLNIIGNQLTGNVIGGPVVCDQGSFGLQCYQPNIQNRLNITKSASTITLTSISPASGSYAGGLGVTLTGTNFNGNTTVTFDNLPATSVNVVNSTTVTAVTPLRLAGPGTVDVVINTPAGSATLTNGFTYEQVAIGQSAYGGMIACLESQGGIRNLIAANSDIPGVIRWGTGVEVNFINDLDGSLNTTNIVNCLTNGIGCVPFNLNPQLPILSYAAGQCKSYTIDSLGNSPCQTGNTCYNDWYLPAQGSSSSELSCLYDNRNNIGGFSNNFYWGSTQDILFPQTDAIGINFANGVIDRRSKTLTFKVRCVRDPGL